MVYDLYEKREILPKINFNQITGKEINPMVIFRFSFSLIWHFETIGYTNLKVIFSRKLGIIIFGLYFAFMGFICSVDGIFGISDRLKWTNITKTDQNNTRNIIFQTLKSCS